MQVTHTYEPALICVGIISAPLESARYAVQSELERTIEKDAFRSALEIINWRTFFERDGRFYDIMRLQMALFSPRQGITVYACNLADGWVSVYENLVKVNAFDAYFFRATLGERAQYKVFEMESWRHGVLVRQVRALQEEGRWDFLNTGDPLPFEDLERYKKREVSKRVDRKLIESYSEAAGYRLSLVAQFAGPCWHFWRNA